MISILQQVFYGLIIAANAKKKTRCGTVFTQNISDKRDTHLGYLSQFTKIHILVLG